MGRVQVNRAGLTLAGVLAAWHAVWAALAATGTAQRVYDFAFRLHFMQSDATVGPFDAATAGMLLLATAAVGYVTGAALAVVWNGLAAMSEAVHARRHTATGLPAPGKPMRAR
ncbi:MAG: hypothetical protein RLZZ111_24 [Planctomycetota bacterium]|jgi:hypothetical protein